MAKQVVVPLRGVLRQYNLSPKGVPEGMMVERVADTAAGSAIVQVLFEPELAGQVTTAAAEGRPVTVFATPFADAATDRHDVYEMVRLECDEQVVVADGAPESDVRARGKAVRLNYARRGEVNGAILDTGDFVHLRPHGAKAVGLELGQTLDVRGEVRGGWSGRRVIEARTVNGVDIAKPPKPHHKPHRPHPHGPPHGPRHHDAASSPMPRAKA